MSEQNNNSIDSLRSSIEQGYRFKTSFRGFNKQEVDQYVKKISDSYKALVDELTAENKRLAGENAQLLQRAEAQEQQLTDMRSDARKRAEAEQNMQQGVVAALRDSVKRLTDDNRRAQMQITDLKQQLTAARDYVAQGSENIRSLNGSLTSMLAEKTKEISIIIDTWGEQYSDAVTQLSERVDALDPVEADYEPTADPQE